MSPQSVSTQFFNCSSLKVANNNHNDCHHQIVESGGRKEDISSVIFEHQMLQEHVSRESQLN